MSTDWQAIDAEAYRMGAERAKRILAFTPFPVPPPQDDYWPSPLSGEYAGDPTPSSLAASLGINLEDDGDVEVACDWYEEGYWDTIRQAYESTNTPAPPNLCRPLSALSPVFDDVARSLMFSGLAGLEARAQTL